MKITEKSFREIIKNIILESQENPDGEKGIKAFIDICKDSQNSSYLGGLEKTKQLNHLITLISKNVKILELKSKSDREIKSMSEMITDELAPQNESGLLIDVVIELFLLRLR